VQLIDDANWKGLQSWQATGSIYNVVPAARQANKPIGEWNALRIICKGPRVSVELNGATLVDANLDGFARDAAIAKAHPGIKRTKGHVGFQSYNFRVEFRNIYLKAL